MTELQEGHFDLDLACDRIANKILKKRQEIVEADIAEQVRLYFVKHF